MAASMNGTGKAGPWFVSPAPPPVLHSLTGDGRFVIFVTLNKTNFDPAYDDADEAGRDCSAGRPEGAVAKTIAKSASAIQVLACFVRS